ncbi:MAG: TrkH family potassium uptake protein [Polyangiaceae bacterium]|nr:TrkH family potassium uptake protein [Polyangiaceae bacterium]
MNWRTVLSVLGYLLLILAACFPAPLVVTVVYDHSDPRWLREVVAFSATLALCLGAGLRLRRRFGDRTESVGRREGFVIVTAAWLVSVLVGMIPFLVVGATASVTDAFFETMSGFTTTGATVFTAEALEGMPRGLMFWRCMTQWLGGMGIVVLSVAILSSLGIGGYRLLKAETPGGVAYERDQPRITDAAKDLWKLYLGISVVQVVLLKLAGTTIYDALCHSFTTMSTGGFSPHGESAAFFRPHVQWILILFMLVAGTNFSLHAHVLRGRAGPLLQSPEARLYGGIVVGCTLLGVLVTPTGANIEERVRDVVFQVVTISTTTGFATKDYDAWPQLMRLVMLLLMVAGGCMGSTAGGIKAARLLIYAKALVRQLHLLVYPRSVRPLRAGDKLLEPAIVANILAFGTLYAFCLLVGAAVMAACGYDLATSASASAAALGNIGPGLGGVGPMQTWGHLPGIAKWVMSLLMLMGRLELFSVVVLFTPWIWTR